MPRARTATTATARSSTGGICQARVISHAETPASASALPSDSTPNAIAEQQSRQSGAQQLTHRQGSPCEGHGRRSPARVHGGRRRAPSRLPLARAAMDCRTRVSIRASRCAVGSSSSSTGAREPSTRASPSRCRWPSDRPTPPRPMHGVQAVGQLGEHLVETRRAAGASRSASGPNSSRLSRTVPGTSTGAGQARPPIPPRAQVERHADRSAVEAQNGVQQRGLADAVGPGDHVTWPGSASMSMRSVTVRERRVPYASRRGVDKRKALSAAVFPSCAE